MCASITKIKYFFLLSFSLPRISMHSTMMGSQFHGEGGPGSIMSGSQYRKDGSMLSGRGSSFQRGQLAST